MYKIKRKNKGTRIKKILVQLAIIIITALCAIAIYQMYLSIEIEPQTGSNNSGTKLSRNTKHCNK